MRQSVIEPMSSPGLMELLHRLPGLAPLPVLLIVAMLAGLGLWLILRAMPYRRQAQQALLLAGEEFHDDAHASARTPESWPASSEQAMRRWRTVLVLKLHFWLRAGPAILCVLVGLWILKQTLTHYPDLPTFIGALVSHPWQHADLVR